MNPTFLRCVNPERILPTRFNQREKIRFPLNRPQSFPHSFDRGLFVLVIRESRNLGLSQGNQDFGISQGLLIPLNREKDGFGSPANQEEGTLLWAQLP